MATVIEAPKELPYAPPAVSGIARQAESDGAKHATISAALESAFHKPDLVKGVGYVDGQKPMDDRVEVIDRLGSAQDALAEATWHGYHSAAEVRKSISPEFQGLMQAAFAGGPAGGMGAWAGDVTSFLGEIAADLGKNFTTSAPLAQGFRPYNLLAPSRLIYPMFTPMRNKLQRTQGQGTNIEAKLVVGIQGSQTGGLSGSKNMFISELSSGNLNANWPNQLPPAGAQAAAQLTLPYYFQGISESLTWPAQFASQGFEDLSGLANLILLQEAMLMEEYQLLANTAHALPAPGTPLLTSRSPGAGETGLSGVTTNVYVQVTCVNYNGETVGSTVASVATANGDVVDVTVTSPPLAGLAYNFYVGTGTAQPANGSMWLMASNVGGVRFTLEGALPTTGTNPPTTNTTAPTGGNGGYEGMLSVSSGWAQSNSVYPTQFMGGYVNKSVGTTLSLDVINAALYGLWDGGTTDTGFGGASFASAGGFRVNPAELIGEGTDIGALSDDIVDQNAGTNYLLTIGQGEVANVTGGAAVSQVVNPATRDILKILVHPWLPQGNALINSYTLNQPWSNVANVWEVNNCQDYLSISWPVIDMSFRYSIALYGTLVCYAPQYNAVLGGLQRHSATPYS